MSAPRLLSMLAALALASACGKKIGDECQVPSDCSSDNDRLCDLSQPGGYCTIAGCDFGTCPSEAVCVRFFPGTDDSAPCTAQEDCAVDQLCTIGGRCASRVSEVRYCMLTCEGDGDCRGGYECRNRELMQAHGGEPVPDPTLSSDAEAQELQAFCAQRQSCSLDVNCPIQQLCDDDSRTCVNRPTCTVDNECTVNNQVGICDTRIGQCVRACEQNVDCATTERCDEATGFCNPI